jgi:hypothetical protein
MRPPNVLSGMVSPHPLTFPAGTAGTAGRASQIMGPLSIDSQVIQAVLHHTRMDENTPLSIVADWIEEHPVEFAGIFVKNFRSHG